MKGITVHLNVDEETILNESGHKNLDDAISQELSWLRDSGMFVDSWSYTEPNKEISKPANHKNSKILICVETDQGLEELVHGFKSESNFLKYPDRICYVPDLWDFELDGPGITGQEILDLCDGDQLQAEMVFSLCDWQHPSTILSEWSPEDDMALKEKRAELTQRNTERPAFADLLNDANHRAAAKQTDSKETEPDRQ